MTQQSKFTPGDWHWVEFEKASVLTQKDGFDNVLTHSYNPDADVCYDVHPSNKRLITAAPEMYELLSHITNHDPLLPCGFCINEARRIKAEIDS